MNQPSEPLPTEKNQLQTLQNDQPGAAPSRTDAAIYEKGAEMLGGPAGIQAITPQGELPGRKVPYYIRSGEGERYLAGGLVVNLVARGSDSGDLYEWAVITGGKGALLPSHSHSATHELLYVLDGEVELWLEETCHLLIRGDFASIPPTTTHAFRMNAHRTQLISVSDGGRMSALYRTLGTPYQGYVQPSDAVPPLTEEALRQAEEAADVRFDRRPLGRQSPRRVTNTEVPKSAVPYVLAAGEGDRYTIGDQLFTMLCDNACTNGRLLFVGTEGPSGGMIIKHFHQEHSESFFCVDGQMGMWANQSLLDIYPGDFMAVPAGTIHAYQLKSPYTRFVGLLTPGIFEEFFRSAHPYTEHVYPQTPTAGPNFAKISKLDLVFVERPGPPPSAQP